MINTRKEYRIFLHNDAIAMGVSTNSFIRSKVEYYMNPRWRFIVKLRRTEYYHAKKSNPVYKLLYYFNLFRYKKLGLRLGFSIPINVFDYGLALPHYGTLVISKKCIIGKNSRIHVCVNIGETNGFAPVIGDNVYIGPGVKIFGNIKLGNNVQIGANAVVNKTFEEDNIVLAGVPAKIVKRL